MGKEARRSKRVAKGKVPLGDQAKARHLRDRRGNLHTWDAPIPAGLVVKKPFVAVPKSKHQSYFEVVENKDKKKKLEFEITTDKEPPPGFEFVPIGNPALTTACKELSREQDAMIFIVSTRAGGLAPALNLELNRIGHHVRQTIVEQARATLGELDYGLAEPSTGVPEPIPEDQDEINRQADATIRDLFPRIPNDDRDAIITRSFKKGAKFNGIPVVGLAPDITLSKRVQLAVISHIRHTHTRYDQLLRETDYAIARRAVEKVCLDILVKWRGDEETGRDQLDEILREVVVISDSEEESEDEDSGDTDMTTAASDEEVDVPAAGPSVPSAVQKASTVANEGRHTPHPPEAQADVGGQMHDAGLSGSRRRKAGAGKAQRGFRRYQAVRDQAWQQALERQRHTPDQPPSRPAPMDMSRSESRTPQVGPLRRVVQHDRPHHHHPYASERDPGSRMASYHVLAQGSNGNRASPSVASYHALSPSRPDSRADHAQYLNRGEAVPGSNYSTGAVSGAAYYSTNDAPVRVRGTAYNENFVPILGPRANLSRSSPGLRPPVSRPAQDLNNYLVPSIEPISPLTSQFSSQRLDTTRQPEQYQEPWQPMSQFRPAMPHPDPVSRNSPLHPRDEPVRVVRWQPEYARNDDMIPATSSDYLPHGASAQRPQHLVRPGIREAVSDYAVPRPHGHYRQVHEQPLARSGFTAEDGAFLRREESRPVVHEDYRPRHDDNVLPRPEIRRIVVDDGSGFRGRPMYVGETVIVRSAIEPRQGPVRAAEDQEFYEVRRAAAPGAEVYREHRVVGLADPYPIPRDDRRGPGEFISVSNMFPRPHAAATWGDDGRAPPAQYPREVRYESADLLRDGFQQLHVQRPSEHRADPPRQERVVRVEYVDYGHPDAGHARPVYSPEPIYRAQDPAIVRPASEATYRAASTSRNLRQDGVIYIE